MAFIAEGSGFSLSRERAEVYYAMLGDLPMAALMVAAQQSLLEPNFSAFPTIEKLRRLAAETMTPEEAKISGVEAWGVAMKAIARCDIEVEGSVERAFKGVPELIRKAVERFGFRELYNLPNGGHEIARAHFIKLFESLASDVKSNALLPPSLRHEIASIQNELHDILPMKPAMTNILASIGKEKP